MTTTDTSRPHGYARYKLDNCRCYVCGFACSTYNANRTYAPCGACAAYVPADTGCGHWDPRKSGTASAHRARAARKRQQDAVTAARNDRETG